MCTTTYRYRCTQDIKYFDYCYIIDTLCKKNWLKINGDSPTKCNKCKQELVVTENTIDSTQDVSLPVLHIVQVTNNTQNDYISTG